MPKISDIINIKREKSFSDNLSDLQDPKQLLPYLTQVHMKQIKVLAADMYFHRRKLKKQGENNETPEESFHYAIGYALKLFISLDRQGRTEGTEVIKRTPLVTDEQVMNRIKNINPR